MRDSLAPHVMLAVMWAALANTVPAAFWAVAFLLQPKNAEHKQRALASLCPEPDTATYVEVRCDPGAACTCTICACKIYVQCTDAMCLAKAHLYLLEYFMQCGCQ